MIYITGDCHSDFRRFSMDNFPEQKEMTKEDTVIICGDFGGIWNKDGESKEEAYWLNWLEDKPFTTVFVDGNHENFKRLYSYPIKEWNGGRVHEVRPHVLHLMRGEIFTIEDKKFFAFGGASSHDIQDGILEMDEDGEWRKIARQWDKEYKMYRIKDLSWWEEEMPNEDEMMDGIHNLEEHDWKVDYIITHSPAANMIAFLGHGLYDQDKLTNYLQNVKDNAEYKAHIMGHMHINWKMDKDVLLYEQIVRIV